MQASKTANLVGMLLLAGWALLVGQGCFQLCGDGQTADDGSETTASEIDALHPDLGPLYNQVAEHTGDLEAICDICNNTPWFTRCWMKASELNPELRDQICARFVEHLTEYAAQWYDDADQRQAFIESHESACLAGMPPMPLW